MCFICVLSSEPALGYTGHVSGQWGVREAVLCGSYELASQGLSLLVPCFTGTSSGETTRERNNIEENPTVLDCQESLQQRIPRHLRDPTDILADLQA